VSREWAASHSRLIEELSSVAAGPRDTEASLAVIKAKMVRLGLAPRERAGNGRELSNSANVEFSITGADASQRLLICAPLEVENMGGVAALLVAAGVWAEEQPAVCVDLAFTVLQGSGPLAKPSSAIAGDDVSVSFVLADPGPIGTVVVSSPSQQTVRIQFTAGAQEDLEGAINGVISESKPAGSLIDGATAVLLVSQLGSTELAEKLAQLADVCQNQAQRYGCSVDIRLTPRFRGYEHPDEHSAVAIWSLACSAVGLDAKNWVSASGSAANFLQAQGVSTVCVGVGSGLSDLTAAETLANRSHLVDLIIALPQLSASA